MARLHRRRRVADGAAVIGRVISVRDCAGQRTSTSSLVFPEEFLTKYKGLVFQIRSEGISVSDRRAVKLLKLFAASAVSTAARASNDSDFFILKHIWNNLDQIELLEEIVDPVVDRYYREHPDERRFVGASVEPRRSARPSSASSASC